MSSRHEVIDAVAEVMEMTGLSAWTLADLCTEIKQRWGVGYHTSHMSKLMRKLGLSRQKARPSHPKADPAAREAWSKGGSKPNWTALPRRIQVAAGRCGLKTKPGSANMAGPAIAGSSAASDRRAYVTSATPGRICSLPCSHTPAPRSPWCCRS